ncbi:MULTISPECIES: lytic transglycosylase domain-containing protein [unclassified Gordonia (in: high G+C Gram-positive bacteria)]|uniref:lytic transglycosylase domain-containing protein n=1 Tax=unclassified Gordonia (in: high G+C Gram-positive bacteria) TaxID=2657482 RepID=UPI001F0FA574|nr:lytic murein transglycosylase [Gordonia sp. ABSL49_1]MCH5643660.1 lytic murein transglycosylase [Gordonia sp. ABSL49_1]
MRPGDLFRRAQGPRRPLRVPRRAIGVATGSVLVGAMVLGTATSSAHGGVTAVAAEEQTPVVVAAVVASEPVTVLGFAPPPPKAAAALTPQLRIATDLPSGPLGIPGVVLQAYKLAANRLGAESPQCKLPWFLLAGIGRIESNHASNGSVDQYGTTINPIAGPVLDGSLAGNAVIHDTDGGRIDGDSAHDRAMGPMQFIPSTWASWGSDANGDGKADPNNVFDATYSAGRYLCAGVSDIMNDSNKVAAVLRYNHSMEYVANVLSWAGAYATGVMPTNPIPEPKHAASSSKKSSSKPSKPSSSKSGSKSNSSSSSSTTTTTKPCVVICLPDITLPPLPGQPRTSPKRTAPNPGARPANPSAGRSTPVPVR